MSNFNLTTYQPNDVTDWLGAFNENMNLLQQFADSTSAQLSEFLQTVANQNSQISNITNETENMQDTIQDFSTQLNSMNTLLTEVNTHLNELSSILTYKKGSFNNLSDSILKIEYIIFGNLCSVKIVTTTSLPVNTGSHYQTDVPNILKPALDTYLTKSSSFSNDRISIDNTKINYTKNTNANASEYFSGTYILAQPLSPSPADTDMG